MRSGVAGLGTPYPLHQFVPAFLQEDDFVVRFTTGLDHVLAPVISVLDCLDAYVDPRLAPEDFLEWVAEWVGATLDDHWSEEHRRTGVLVAAEMHRLRGTVPGLRSLVALATGGEVEVGEGGAQTRWSTRPTEESAAGAGPGHERRLVIRISVDDPVSIRQAALEELVRAAKPAHLPHTIEVVPR